MRREIPSSWISMHERKALDCCIMLNNDDLPVAGVFGGAGGVPPREERLPAHGAQCMDASAGLPLNVV